MKDQNFILEPFQKNNLTNDLNIKGIINRQSNLLFINYELIGKLSEILVPNKSELPTRRNNLWDNTCFEFFIAIKDLPQYWEFNLSPSGDWNVYHFKDYHVGMIEELTFKSLPLKTQNQSELFQVSLECDLEKIINKSQSIELAISSVIRHKNNELSYWALTHCESKADFHIRNSFILEL